MENLCECKILDDDDIAKPKYVGKNRGTIYTDLCTWADDLIPGLIFFPGNYNT